MSNLGKTFFSQCGYTIFHVHGGASSAPCLNDYASPCDSNDEHRIFFYFDPFWVHKFLSSGVDFTLAERPTLCFQK